MLDQLPDFLMYLTFFDPIATRWIESYLRYPKDSPLKRKNWVKAPSVSKIIINALACLLKYYIDAGSQLEKILFLRP